MELIDQLGALLPELVLTALLLLVITVDLFLPRGSKWLLTPLTVLGLLIAGAACFFVWGTNQTVYEGYYVVDDLSIFIKGATIVTGILSALFAPSYLLTGLHKTDRYSNEGGLKYFLLGSFASAILLFGTAWTYGLTGTTSVAGIADVLAGGQMNAGILVAIGFLTVGATFKIAAVPFHYWTPDAYQG